jgi:hypothetical protein
MKNTYNKIALFTILSVSMLCFFSCGKEQYLEKRSGPWKITNVDIAYYKNYSNTPDSLVNFSSDTLGYFNFYHGSPSSVYVLINYPSVFLIKDYSARYEVHEENHDILVIKNLVGPKWVERRFTVSSPNSSAQEWTIINDNLSGYAVRETITVEKE